MLDSSKRLRSLVAWLSCRLAVVLMPARVRKERADGTRRQNAEKPRLAWEGGDSGAPTRKVVPGQTTFAASSSRRAACPGTIFRFASSRLTHSPRPTAEKPCRWPDRGGHSREKVVSSAIPVGNRLQRPTPV